MEDATRNQFLRDEYLQIQKTIEDLDSKILNIKSWSAAFGSATIGAAFATHNVWVLIASILGGLCFWILETNWKTFQIAYYKRNGELEKFFAEETPDLKPFQIAATWFPEWQSYCGRLYYSVAWWRHVCLPHLVIVGFASIVLGTVLLIWRLTLKYPF